MSSTARPIRRRDQLADSRRPRPDADAGRYQSRRRAQGGRATDGPHDVGGERVGGDPEQSGRPGAAQHDPWPVHPRRGRVRGRRHRPSTRARRATPRPCRPAWQTTRRRHPGAFPRLSREASLPAHRDGRLEDRDATAGEGEAAGDHRAGDARPDDDGAVGVATRCAMRHPAEVRRESSRTMRVSTSGSVSGGTPWPRLTMWASAASPRSQHVGDVGVERRLGGDSSAGSMLPCSGTPAEPARLVERQSPVDADHVGAEPRAAGRGTRPFRVRSACAARRSPRTCVEARGASAADTERS